LSQNKFQSQDDNSKKDTNSDKKII